MNRLLVILVILLLPVSSTLAEAPGICRQPSRDPAPSLRYPPDDDREARIAAFNLQLMNYLNTTGSSDGLEDAVHLAVPDATQILSAEVREIDMTGDNALDVIVNFSLTVGADGSPYETALSLFTCVDGRYVLADSVPDYDFNKSPEGIPVNIETVADLNNDDRPDIVLRDKPGLQKYEERIRIIEWDGTALAEIFTLGPDYMGFNSITVYDPDSPPNMPELVVGNEYGYGQGVALSFSEIWHYRPINTFYRWNGDTLVPVCRGFTDTPETLYETLHSAETRRACGSYQAAMGYYQRMWEDRSLQTWHQDYILIPESVTDETAYLELERAYLRAFAGYRLIQIYLAQQNFAAAEDLLNQLTESYEPGKPGILYTVMAVAYSNAYLETYQPADACDAAAKVYGELARIRETGFDPGIRHYEEVSNGETRRYGFYYYSGITYSSDPDNVFDVPPDIQDMIQIPVCLEGDLP